MIHHHGPWKNVSHIYHYGGCTNIHVRERILLPVHTVLTFPAFVPHLSSSNSSLLSLRVALYTYRHTYIVCVEIKTICFFKVRGHRLSMLSNLLNVLYFKPGTVTTPCNPGTFKAEVMMFWGEPRPERDCRDLAQLWSTSLECTRPSQCSQCNISLCPPSLIPSLFTGACPSILLPFSSFSLFS